MVISAWFSSYDHGKRFRMFSIWHGKEGILPTRKRFNFDLEDADFKDMCRGFVHKNTAAETEKCMQLFQSWGQACAFQTTKCLETFC